MYTVRDEIYVNDYTKKFSQVFFPDLKALMDWQFSMMVADIKTHMTFPKKSDDPPVWKFTPEEGGPTWIIHEVSNDEGIVFSDGFYTDGQTHCAKSVRTMLDECIKKQKARFKFVEES